MLSRKPIVILYILLGIAYIGGLFLQIMDVDAAQYAAMSMEMLKTKSFLKLYDGGMPYLDKPPLLFWVSTLSFYLFGVSEFTYRLPSFLATILAIYSTYKLAKLWYNDVIAQWSALILASCQAFFLFNNDVKTDDLLTGMVIFSIWQLAAFIRTKKPAHFILGFIGVGLAMLAKGPIGLILPAAAIGADLLLKRKWKEIFNFRWLLAVPIILLVLSPFLVGLYQQWGWHGINFFFWTQSFGRITGQSEWDNGSSPFFFVHTFLWAFLPWTLCSLTAMYLSVKELVKKRFRLDENSEGLTICGFILIFIALSMSHYKLPHYIFVLFPLSAVFTARWIYDISQQEGKGWKWIYIIQFVIYCLLGIAVTAIITLVFKPINVEALALVVLLALSVIVLAIKIKDPYLKIMVPGIFIASAVNIGLNFDFYPRLLHYQSSNQAGMFASTDARVNKKIHIPDNKFYSYMGSGCHSLTFYAKRDVNAVYRDYLKDTLKKRDIWLYVISDDYKGLDSFARFNNNPDIVLDRYGVQNLSLAFLNPETRNQAITHAYLVHLACTDTTAGAGHIKKSLRK